VLYHVISTFLQNEQKRKERVDNTTCGVYPQSERWDENENRSREASNGVHEVSLVEGDGAIAIAINALEDGASRGEEGDDEDELIEGDHAVGRAVTRVDTSNNPEDCRRRSRDLELSKDRGDLLKGDLRTTHAHGTESVVASHHKVVHAAEEIDGDLTAGRLGKDVEDSTDGFLGEAASGNSEVAHLVDVNKAGAVTVETEELTLDGLAERSTAPESVVPHGRTSRSDHARCSSRRHHAGSSTVGTRGIGTRGTGRIGTSSRGISSVHVEVVRI